VYFKVRRRTFKRRRRNFNIVPEPSKESPKEHGMVKRVEGWFIPFYNYKGIIIATIVLFGSYIHSKRFIVFQKTVAITIMKGLQIH